MDTAKYEIEIWDKNGIPLADIRDYVIGSLHWSKTLNGAESVDFTVDLPRFEKLIRTLGYEGDPFSFFEVGRTDIRIKRNGKYLIGCNVYKLTYTTDDPSINMQVQCVGYLNFYKTQYVTAEFENVYQEEILWRVIDQCNQKTGGDYGVRQGTHIGEHIARNRHYARKEVASLIQQMSNVIDGCDFEFTPDKKFNTYMAKGVYRPSVRVAYPGNIQTFSFSRSIEKTANFIYGLGSGNGEDTVASSAEDEASENYLYRREKIITWNSVTVQDTVDEHTDSALKHLKDAIEIPRVTLRPGTLDLSEVDVGDTITLQISDSLILQHITGDYRIYNIECDVDGNDSETVSLEFDNYDIDEIIANQGSEDE